MGPRTTPAASAAVAGSGSVHRRLPDSPAVTALISAQSGSGDIDIDGR